MVNFLQETQAQEERKIRFVVGETTTASANSFVTKTRTNMRTNLRHNIRPSARPSTSNASPASRPRLFRVPMKRVQSGVLPVQRELVKRQTAIRPSQSDRQNFGQLKAGQLPNKNPFRQRPQLPDHKIIHFG